MTTSKKSLPDAIVYIPGLEGQLVDDAALRIASAFDIGANTPAAEFSLGTGQDEDYVPGADLKTRVRTIHRVEPGKEPKKIVDVYEFDCVSSLIKGHVESNIFVKGGRLFLQLIRNVPHLLGAFLGGKQKTALEKLQYTFSILIISLLVAYLVVLCIAIYDTVREVLLKTQAVASQPQPADGSAEQEQGEASNLTIAQFLVILFAAVEVFYPNIKQTFIDQAVRYTALIEYLDVGTRHQAIAGQLVALIDHVAAKGYRNIHIVAYSFGSIVALDNLFPTERMPVKRLREIHTLVTVGCPFDLIRAFWPDYFTKRIMMLDVPKCWINVYSPMDVMGSNFRNDSLSKAPDPDNAIVADNRSLKLIPQISIAWNSGRPKRRMSFGELLTMAGLEAHRTYWEKTFESDNSVFSPVVEEIYKNDYALS